MGAVSGLLGTAGGVNGTGLPPAQLANLMQPVQQGQVDQSYLGTQASLQQQQALLQALQSQNGLGNQTSVYNQLQGVTDGTGPNPAQAMLAQSTGQNVANQAALMAGQRGASQNVGLIARQAAQQGASTQQQAAGQAATLQANQSLNALGQQAGIANTQASNLLQGTNANTQAQTQEQGNLLNAVSGYNTSQVNSQNSVNAANAGLANTTMQGQQALIGGAANSISGIAAAFAEGGDAEMAPNPGGAQSSFGKFMQAVQAGAPEIDYGNPGANALSKGVGGVGAKLASAFNSNAPVTGGGGMMNFAMSQGGPTHDYRTGGKVKASKPAEKAQVAGNSYANDKIPAVLSEGEYVLDRETLNDPGPLGNEARRLVAALKSLKGK